jgi:hypothetical protein
MLCCNGEGGPAAGITRSRAVGCNSVVVKIKKMMSKKPRSTIGVISIRITGWYRLPFRCGIDPVSIVAITDFETMINLMPFSIRHQDGYAGKIVIFRCQPAPIILK